MVSAAVFAPHGFMRPAGYYESSFRNITTLVEPAAPVNGKAGLPEPEGDVSGRPRGDMPVPSPGRGAAPAFPGAEERSGGPRPRLRRPARPRERANRRIAPAAALC
ncbi:MAG: hypothetical protein H6Q78_1289 [Candidatus Krumholzibacteriota bacterium]|nr:hypothetical protein [Candidatus Krumholzibacteriota bacterium]